MSNRKLFFKKIIRKLSHWLWFGLGLSLLPLGFVAWKIMGHSPNMSNGVLEQVISHGELLLICMSTLGAAIGELISKETKWLTVRTWITGAALFLALFAAFSYSEAATSKLDIKLLYTTSVNTFYATLIVAISSLILPSREEENV